VRHLAECVPDSRRSHAAELRLIALSDFPQVASGDDLAALTAAALTRSGLALHTDDVLVFAQKVISKAEGRRVDLATVTPSEKALELAQTVQKDARLVELVLRESRRIVRCAKDVLIVEHRLGLIMANAGIDQSNVADPAGGEFALLLPEDPDASAARLRARLCTLTGCEAGSRHQRQLRTPLARGHGRRGDRLRWISGNAGPARSQLICSAARCA
jgi:coenzyme F420-0:L-glutamate ligase/coenzyme F420-1:gamma-L-glutamate ligase